MKAPQKTTFRITDKAGEYIAGKRRVPGAETVMLTAREAAYDLSLGTLELMEDKSAARKRTKPETSGAGETANGEG
ncbi:hypothetical protein HDIA_2276 [Hartmannibacter diazotrophicus]|uniref:Uncharacterized protein n=1 Tax=Hartmannibacter diazotrophicus TaxID=1482074 RepID=A0A2C9D680_9HYPH|nr:hypothetical protein [Hartmannibacter diazotrophicus]SON55817.1 hypothetical protein HDIA_2276 [Hartmannibacter diazotrophicus]